MNKRLILFDIYGRNLTDTLFLQSVARHFTGYRVGNAFGSRLMRQSDAQRRHFRHILQSLHPCGFFMDERRDDDEQLKRFCRHILRMVDHRDVSRFCAQHHLRTFIMAVNQQRRRMPVDESGDDSVHVVIGDGSPIILSAERVERPQTVVITLSRDDGNHPESGSQTLRQIIGTAHMT